MIDKRVCCYLFLLIFFESALLIRPSFHGHNNAFVQDENDVQYLLDNIPISMHKEFTNSVHGSGEVDDKLPDSLPYIKFEPHILDFKERQLGVPHQETVTLINNDQNRTIHLTSISGSTQHFHSSFFQDKVIPPLGNTSFNVVFLGREEGEIDSHLLIHTSDGTLKYHVKGLSVSSPYRLRPVIGVKLPLNASFTPLIYMHNPHSETIQVVEVYSSGGEFQLELPTGEAEGPRELWEIPAYQTKPVIRLHFNAYMEKNHTAYVRFKMNNSAEVMVVAVEIEVGNGAGIHWAGQSAWINFGVGGSLQSPLNYPIVLRNSAKKPVRVLNVISTPISKALKINFEPVTIPPDTENPVTVGTLTYDWKNALDLKHLRGKLVIKSLGPGGSNQKISIPWTAEVIQGGLELNATVTHYCAPYSHEPRNFSVVNRFSVPLAITNVTLAPSARALFKLSNFSPRILKPGEKLTLFTLTLQKNSKDDDKLESSVYIYSNVTTTVVPLLIYNGKVNKIIPVEYDDDQQRGVMNFGTVSSGTENEAIFALENKNPVNIELHGWGVNMPGAVLELMGCQFGPTELFNKGLRNITACAVSGSQNIKPNYLAIFKIKVKTPTVEEDTIVGDVFVRTTYERLTIPVYMRVAHGKITLKRLTFTDCFPGSVCTHALKMHSSFGRPMRVLSIGPTNKDARVHYLPLEQTTIISKGDNNVGTIVIDTAITCKQNCYLGLSLNTTTGNQWLQTMSLPSHARDLDLNLLTARYNRYLNTSSNDTIDNITMKLETTEVRGYKFNINVRPNWPSLIFSEGHSGSKQTANKSVVSFPLTQVGNTTYKTLRIYNPSTKVVVVQLVMDWLYPQGQRLYHLLPGRFKTPCNDCMVSDDFKLADDSELCEEERKKFEATWNIVVKKHSVALVLQPNATRIIKISYTPKSSGLTTGLLFIRNNLTVLEVVRFVGRGGYAQFKFGNRKPNSPTPLLFELSDKHLRDCERERLRKNPVPNLTVKRSFTARNTGELPINIYGFYINGLECVGYGFKVLNCEPFVLHPNATRKIDIAFTPDFTLARIERQLMISTSLGTDLDEKNNLTRGMVKLTLLTTVPMHSLELCSRVIIRPSWERPVQWAAISLSCILLICVLAISFLEADRILRNALITMSRNNTGVVQPPLDLRSLAVAREKDDKMAGKKREEPDWSLMNVSKKKEKDLKDLKEVKDKDRERNLNFKIPDWSAEEERRFKMDMQMKDEKMMLLDEDEVVVKKIKKKDEKSPKSLKEDKRKHNNNNSNNHNSNNSNNSNNTYKKYETSQKISYSEEETSSTTTESSLQDDALSKETNPPKVEKVGKKVPAKKVVGKSVVTRAPERVQVQDFRDNYEGDCDDDDYFYEQNGGVNGNGTCKEKENVNKWRTNTNKGKREVKNAMMEKQVKKVVPKKDKMTQKRRNDKTKVNLIDNKDVGGGKVAVQVTAVAPPPPCWGENRAKFSDVVARSTECAYPRVDKPPINVKGKMEDKKDKRSDYFDVKFNGSSHVPSLGQVHIHAQKQSDAFALAHKQTEALAHAQKQMGALTHAQTFKCRLGREENNLSSILNTPSNSYFINTFETNYEPELVPYDDLPETDEPLVELESLEEDTRAGLWTDKSPMMGLLDANYSGLEPVKADKLGNGIEDSLKDNWLTVETNWEPLYTRGAVGEERSGVWGVNTGGVWAAAPWGAPTPPSGQINTTEQDVQERSGFDPFRSLSTIWTPNTSWDTKKE
ncbi:transmembrane protein 131 [Microplitis demolitor]|uniref:transmembrane protein 131 n=1 Tax=Microplitis demolitor TaxID=69319 RepID=UPI00044003CF|nr:transmembrane protein 131 [Microplitis demolitor]